MSATKVMMLLCAALAVSAPMSPSQLYTVSPQSYSDWPAKSDDLSVLTYNVKGLPWPAALGRDDALDAIGKRLSLMRRRGVQPQIVLLQEAFTDDAEDIGRTAGYRYRVRGPSSRERLRSAPLGENFSEEAQWSKGEASGPVVNSGLVILSDFPIERVKTLAFPDGACAGFDCLATKGMVIAWVKVPGLDAPLAVANTHLNSRRSTHVSRSRADEAFAWQSAAIRDFVESEVEPDAPIIFGGDFNAGRAAPRRAAFDANLPLGPRQEDALATALANRSILPSSQTAAFDTITRNRDKILFRSGAGTKVTPQLGWVPFGEERSSSPLSDHTGFVVSFTLTRNTQGNFQSLPQK